MSPYFHLSLFPGLVCALLLVMWPPNAGAIANPSGPLQRDESFVKFKEMVKEQAPAVAALKTQGLASEGRSGFLVGAETLDLQQRELIQKENYYREKLFAIIALHTEVPVGEVASLFAARSTPAEQPDA